MKNFSRYFPVYFVTDGLGRIGGRYIGRGGCPIRARTQVRVMKRLGDRLRMLDRTIDSGSGLVFIEPFVRVTLLFIHVRAIEVAQPL